MSADSQWNNSLTAGLMSPSAPDHTETDKSITFIAANAATPSRGTRSYPVVVVLFPAPSANSVAEKPARFSASIKSCDETL